ncbi:MAG TPA: hypothetical protein VD948_09075, partial [Rhodothermales bacterium]|nr:hypothetical protein [Rhodothermales bacterium]
PSVQTGVWRAVTAKLAEVGNPWVSVVFVHPMYGPNGFRAHEPEARTFQNILAGVWEAPGHPISREVARLAAAFWRTFHIATTSAFDAEAHDRITAYSQGLSYCVASLMFARTDLDARVREALPDLHLAFHANRALIQDFLRLNAYVPQVQAAFDEAWRATAKATYEDLLAAFAQADATLNGDAPSPIPTKWYEKLRTIARPGL